ncbi:uncharacterized protein LOC108840392 isoform X2 [Raphanus sativus]|uniref:Uncharacterized protein LOC108840392 isoform X2 n=1 Tax=Raphanus sativus TaxID=3726 RepID=A0A9W3CEG3_RAPSA|nr:uncharacterized protein LOC108840392 isoform X2 [Raphanus sativus]
MASSSQNNFDEAFDDAFEDTFDEAFDDGFDQAFEHLTIHLDQEERRQKRKKRAYIERHREEGHIRLWNDYFSETPTYLPNLFRRRFRMNKSLFMHIVDRLSNEVQYFRETHDALGRKSLSPLQKCTAAIRVLAYGSAADTVDEYLRLECRGFPGMIGSIDCIHWEWKNCPSAWKGQYARGSGKPTIVLEAVASFDLWIWHAFFGLPGTLNDINVLDRSPVFDDIINGQAPNVTFYVNGRQYDMAYYLTDGIYPKWATFIQSIPLPQGPKAVLFAQWQEAYRKDVERAFGVLQARFAIVKNPVLFWDRVKIGKIMRACIILHNMIVQDERDGYTPQDDSEWREREDPDDTFSTAPSTVGTMINVEITIRDRQLHQRLKDDLVQHIWRRCGRDEGNN